MQESVKLNRLAHKLQQFGPRQEIHPSHDHEVCCHHVHDQFLESMNETNGACNGLKKSHFNSNGVRI